MRNFFWTRLPSAKWCHHAHLFTQVVLKTGAASPSSWTGPTLNLLSFCFPLAPPPPVYIFPFYLKKECPLRLSVSILLHLHSLLARTMIEPHPGPVQDPCSVCGNRVGAGCVVNVRPMVPPPLCRNTFHCKLTEPCTMEPPNMLHPGATVCTHPRVGVLGHEVHLLDSRLQAQSPSSPTSSTPLYCPD